MASVVLSKQEARMLEQFAAQQGVSVEEAVKLLIRKTEQAYADARGIP